VHAVSLKEAIMPSAIPWRGLLVGAGAAQLVLVVVSLAIPRWLRWAEDLRHVRPLTRQVFWTYAGYIWTTNLGMGLVSTIGARFLLDGSPLATAVCGFIALYWGARVVIQFVYFDRTDAPKGWFFVMGEVALVGLFITLTLIYTGIAARSIWTSGP
jgi:hypothetical protein